MLTLLLTCPYGLASVLNQELKYLKYKPFDSFDTGTFVQTDRNGLMHLNLRSRIASKIYVQLQKPTPCTSFDELYIITHAAPRAERLPGTEFLTISVHTHQSQLHAPRSIQSIVHKAVRTHLKANGQALSQHTDTPYDIFCHLDRDQVSLWLNTSGTGLHQRGYRSEAGTAPLKENVAAALVLISGRRRQDTLRDPCCGAGTICIEAAMIARNIAPGLQRSFAFQEFTTYPEEQFATLISEATAKVFTKPHALYGSDIDADLLQKAQHNAQRAGVADTIRFSQINLLETTDTSFLNETETKGEISSASPHIHLITNPPYGNRLKQDDIKQLYKQLLRLSTPATHHLTLITSYPDFSHLLNAQRPRREVTNGPDRCHIRQKPKG